MTFRTEYFIDLAIAFTGIGLEERSQVDLSITRSLARTKTHISYLLYMSCAIVVCDIYDYLSNVRSWSSALSIEIDILLPYSAKHFSSWNCDEAVV